MSPSPTARGLELSGCRRLAQGRALRSLAALFALVLAFLGASTVAEAFGPPEVSYADLRTRYGVEASEYIELAPGLVVHVRDEGLKGGPVLVMVHGFGASAADWQPWIDRLGDKWRIITLDLPGHGLTEAPRGYRASITGFVGVIDAVAQRKALSPFVIIGNSMGGETAWRYALDHGDRLRGLVLVDAAGWRGRPRPGGALLFTLMRLPPARFLLKAVDERPLASQGLKAAFVDEALVTPALIDRYVAFSRAPGHKDILLNIRQGPEDAASAEGLARIRTPTLVIVGAKDRLIPPTDGRRFADAIPGARLVEFADAGHVPMEQIPDRSAAALTEFLKTLAPQGS